MAMLLHLAGAVALLLYATRMVRTGVERAGGPLLRRRLQAVLSNPLSAALIGAVLVVTFQSVTAVNLLLSSPARMRFGISPMINAIGILFIAVTIICAVIWSPLRQRGRRREAAV